MDWNPRPLLTMALLTVRGSLTGAKGIGLVVIAYLPTIVLAALILHGGVSGVTLANVFGILQLLFLLLMALVVLLLAVPLFRDEIDRQSISYLLTRSLAKPFIVLGKYLGCATVSLAVLLPPVVVSYAIVAGWGQVPSHATSGMLPAMVLVTTLGVLAYAALFLLLGLLTRHALILGLIYVFLWEFFLSGVSGVVPDASILYYLLSAAGHFVAYGPFAGYPTNLTFAQAVGGPLALVPAFLVLSMALFHYLNLVPSPE